MSMHQGNGLIFKHCSSFCQSGSWKKTGELDAASYIELVENDPVLKLYNIWNSKENTYIFVSDFGSTVYDSNCKNASVPTAIYPSCPSNSYSVNTWKSISCSHAGTYTEIDWSGDNGGDKTYNIYGYKTTGYRTCRIDGF